MDTYRPSLLIALSELLQPREPEARGSPGSRTGYSPLLQDLPSVPDVRSGARSIIRGTSRPRGGKSPHMFPKELRHERPRRPPETQIKPDQDFSPASSLHPVRREPSRRLRPRSAFRFRGSPRSSPYCNPHEHCNRTMCRGNPPDRSCWPCRCGRIRCIACWRFAHRFPGLRCQQVLPCNSPCRRNLLSPNPPR